jgi:nucleoside-diphosphate-sugar epimerase
VSAAAGPATILITGNMGYVGPSVVSRLHDSNPEATLVGLDTGYFAHCLTGAVAMPERCLGRQHFLDVRAVPDSLFAAVDAVVHLAGISNDPIGNLYDTVTLSVNHKATVRLARQAKAAGARSFVFASSCSVYGASEEDEATEKSPTQPLTPYALSKWLAERDLAELADDSFVITSLRFGTACGMSERLRLDLVLNDFVASAIATHRITILSDGTPWRPLIHVLDMARAVEWALGREASSGGDFLAVNVGSEQWNYRIRELAEQVAAIIPRVDVSVSASSGPDKRSYRVNFDLYGALAPDHLPTVDLPSTVEELREGLERFGFNDAEFRHSRLVRLFVLEELRERGLVNDSLEWVSHAPTYADAH